MKPPVKKLAVIAVLVILGVFVALPREVPVKFKFQKIRVERTFHLPGINIKLGGFTFTRDLNLKPGLDLAGGSHLVFDTDLSGISTDSRTAAVDAARSTIERRVNLFGVSESIVYTTKVGTSDRIAVDLPGVRDTQQAIQLIGKTAKLDFREVEEPARESTSSAFLITLQSTKATGFTGADFQKARPSFDSTGGKPVVSFEIKPESVRKFGDITTRLVGKRLAIFLDDLPVSAPVVQQAITSGSGQISGEFTQEEVKELSNLLNSGALPVPIKLIEQRTVEASLGAQSVQKSMLAGAIGLATVILFMVLNYGRLGILASLALLFYGILTISVYKLLPVVLTLPGIAGFILSLGMAVDSNILIFERMKEELRAGKPRVDAMESAFGRAWDSIRDANGAALLIVFVLLNPLNLSFLHTSGPIRGFALTLGLGIVLSLFTGVFVTRTLMRWWERV